MKKKVMIISKTFEACKHFSVKIGIQNKEEAVRIDKKMEKIVQVVIHGPNMRTITEVNWLRFMVVALTAMSPILKFSLIL